MRPLKTSLNRPMDIARRCRATEASTRVQLMARRKALKNYKRTPGTSSPNHINFHAKASEGMTISWPSFANGLWTIRSVWGYSKTLRFIRLAYPNRPRRESPGAARVDAYLLPPSPKTYSEVLPALLLQPFIWKIRYRLGRSSPGFLLDRRFHGATSGRDELRP